jgi:hypothetical protein
MKYAIGQELCGFVVEQSRPVKEIGGDLYILRHIHSGAALCYIDNSDRNMTYAVTFATPSADSTGVFHILEHSVLCGSEKYPVDDPFVELMKSSLYTFLNAMTFPDKTMYPVSSMNEKDLMNLMAVYTDAVFRPLIYDNENAFRQEGWHIELDENGKPYYQGVVYNEMKGALGDPDETLYNAVFREAYEPCQYTTVSGGYPDDIVRLTYEQFIDTHRRHYHPSNARFYLYGKMNLEEKLEFLDREYLGTVAPQPAVEEPAVKLRKQAAPYYCTYQADEEKTGEDYIAFTYPVGMMPTLERSLALSVLSNILCETNYDPLKKRILDKGLAVEVECGMIDDLCLPLFTVKLRHCDASRLDEIDREITDCLQELIAHGIDRDAARAKLNTIEFSLREGNASGLTKGLYYGIQIAGSWLYGYEPWRYLEYEEGLAAVKEGLDNRYFENLIKEALLDNAYRTVIVMTPKAGENRYSEPTDLPDGYTAENRRSDADPIPHLSLADIGRSTVPHPTSLYSQDGAPYLYHPVDSDGIVYAGLFFDTADADDDELFCLSLVASLLTLLGTGKHTGEELQTQLGLYTGAMAASNTVYDYEGRVLSALTLRYKAIADSMKDASALAQEIAASTRFDDGRAILDIIRQLYTDMQLGLINNSSQIALTRAAAVHNVRDAITDKQRGLSFYTRLKTLKNDLDSGALSIESLSADLERVYTKFVRSGRAVMSLACDEPTYETIRDIPLPMRENLTDRLGNADSPLLSGNIAVAAPCDIVFNGYSYDLSDENPGGVLILAKKILSLEYLWQKIRVENGAYGCGATVGSAKRLDLWSYRDPQIRATLSTYDGAADFLSTLSLGERAVEDYIISCIRGLDNPTTPQAAAYVSDLLYLSGRTDDVLQKERDELLSATLADINALGERMTACVPGRAYCTVGSAESISASAALFDEIIKL